MNNLNDGPEPWSQYLAPNALAALPLMSLVAIRNALALSIMLWSAIVWVAINTI